MRGHLVKRGKRSWRYKLDLAPDANGGRRTVYHTLRAGSRREAEMLAAKILTDVGAGTHVSPSAETVGGFTARWLDTWARNNTAGTTFERYQSLLRHVSVKVGAVPLQKLSAADLQSVYASMAKRGLARQTQRHVHRVVHRMLGHAVQWGAVARNIAGMVDAPRVAGREVEILSPEQIRVALEALKGKPLHVIAVTLLGTGLRRGEVLALRWQDLDLDGSTLRVEQSVEETQAGGRHFKPPKNKHSRRAVSLPASVVAALRTHRTAMQERSLAVGRRLTAKDLVFADWDGGPRSPHTLTAQWRKAMKAAGLKVTPHALRHTCASALISAGLDVLTISRKFGHSSPTITLQIYGHLFRPDDRSAAILEAVLSEPST